MSIFNKLLRIIAIILLIIAIVVAIYAAAQFYMLGASLADPLVLPFVNITLNYGQWFALAAAAAVMSIVMDPTIFGKAISNISDATADVVTAAGTVLDATSEAVLGVSFGTAILIGVGIYGFYKIDPFNIFGRKKRKSRSRNEDSPASPDGESEFSEDLYDQIPSRVV